MFRASSHSHAGLARAIGLALAAASAWHLAQLAYIVATRVAFPLDIDWLEGGSVYEAYRIAHGEPVYTTGPTGFLPYPYPPLYFALVAALGRVTGSIGYGAARLLSVVPLAAVAFAAARLVRFHATERGLSARQGVVLALAAAALIAATYPTTLGAYDIARPDSLAAAFAVASVIAASRRDVRARDAILSAVLMTLTLFTKQTHIVLAFAMGCLLVWRDRAVGAVYFAAVGALSLTGFLVLERATSGAFATWIFGLRHDAFHYGRLLEGAARLIVGAPHLVAIAIAAAWRWGTLSPRSRTWVVACTATVPAALVPFAKASGAANNFVPLMVFAGPTAVLVLLDVAASASRRLAVPLLATALAGLLAGRIYDGDFLRPTLAMQRLADSIVQTIGSLDGDVLCPIHPYLPVVAGHDGEQAPLLSHYDAAAAQFPGVRVEDYVAYVRARKPQWIVLSNAHIDEDLLQPLLAQEYVLARVLDGPEQTGVASSMPRKIYARKSER